MSRKRREIEEQGLDLVPIMNLVTILIPFLLMSAQFVSLAVIDSSLPAIGEPEPVDPSELDDEEKLDLSLIITGEGFTITGKGTKLVLPEDDEVNGPKIPCIDAGCASAESYDYKELTRRLTLLKDRFPDEENAILVPEGDTLYEVLILSMDATRNDQDDTDDEGKARVLFPNVVLAGGVN